MGTLGACFSKMNFEDFLFPKICCILCHLSELVSVPHNNLCLQFSLTNLRLICDFQISIFFDTLRLQLDDNPQTIFIKT